MWVQVVSEGDLCSDKFSHGWTQFAFTTLLLTTKTEENSDQNFVGEGELGWAGAFCATPPPGFRLLVYAWVAGQRCHGERATQARSGVRAVGRS
jgi:hypothetical protein